MSGFAYSRFASLFGLLVLVLVTLALALVLVTVGLAIVVVLVAIAVALSSRLDLLLLGEQLRIRLELANLFLIVFVVLAYTLTQLAQRRRVVLARRLAPLRVVPQLVYERLELGYGAYVLLEVALFLHHFFALLVRFHHLLEHLL